MEFNFQILKRMHKIVAEIQMGKCIFVYEQSMIKDKMNESAAEITN